jgi:hypothetical protein
LDSAVSQRPAQESLDQVLAELRKRIPVGHCKIKDLKESHSRGAVRLQ